MNKQKLLTIIIIAIAVVSGCALVSKGLTNFRKQNYTISVTGKAEKQITSDLIIWRININADGKTRQEAYNQYVKTAKILTSYLTANGISKDNISMSAAELTKNTRSYYDKNDHYITEDDGFSVSQSLVISSRKLDTVEDVYRKIGTLYNQGIDFSSNSPEYYYTKLNDLKMEMLEAASANAYQRATIIAKGSESSIGKLTDSSMGVFQILGLNSDEDYSWGGTFNTSSKVKVASITVKAVYEAE